MVNKKIYILAPAIGVAGGADKATKLLAEAYSDLNYEVSVFATSCEVSLKSQGIKVFPPIIKYGHRWKWPHISLVLKLLFLCAVKRPAFLHCVGLTYEVNLALKLLKRLNIIVWETTEADIGNKFVDQDVLKHLKFASRMLAPSLTIKRNIRKNYSYDGVISILPFWTEWQPTIHVGKKRTNSLLYVGRLDLDKGFEYLFEAMRLVNEDIKLTLDICGRGDLDKIKLMSRDLNNINFHGYVGDDYLAKLYKEADFLVLPSKHEGYPLSLIEACGKGIPIIASKVGSIPEVYQDSGAALLFDSGNSEQLANCIRKGYSENEKQYEERSSLARQLYERINNREAVQSRLTQLINDLQ